MKPYSSTLLLLTSLLFFTGAQKPNTTGINWLSLEEAQQKMQQKPKKLFVDLYTDWCGWCKVMDKNSFSHPVIQELMNQYFYAVKFNAEKGDSLQFNGKGYRLLGRSGRPLHQWAKAFGSTEKGLSYPTTILFDHQLNKIQTIPGYLDAHTLEKVLVYIGNDFGFKGMSWPDFEANYPSRIPPSKKETKKH